MKGLTQKTIGFLTGYGKSHISRWFANNNIKSINKLDTSASHGKMLRYDVDSVRQFCRSSIFDKYERGGNHVISFYNFKGGTGKTSISFQVSTHLAMMGFNVLVIDTDPQGHLSSSLGFDSDSPFPTLSDVISNYISISEVCKEVFTGLKCVPANLSLTKLEVMLNEMPKREERLKIILDQLDENFDFIILDTNPTISLVNRNVLACSDLVSIVCETQPYSLQGMNLLMEDMTRFYNNMQMQLPEILIIPNKYEDRSLNSAEAMSVLNSHYGEYMIPNFAIRKSEDFVTAAKRSEPLGFFVRSNSNALEDVSDLLHTIIGKFYPQFKEHIEKRAA